MFKFLFLILSISVQAQIIEESWKVQFPQEKDLQLLSSRPELTLDHRTKNSIEVYGPTGTGMWLRDLGMVFGPLPKIQKSALNSYPSYIEHTKTLERLAQTYPHILQLFSIGKSVEGRELWVMKISDNVSSDEVEPEFKYISSMHGDEITGREMMMKLIDLLATSYSSNARIKGIIDNTEIFIMPSMNPDGSETPQRGNARYIDLNRNFPSWARGDREETVAGRERETVAVMNFQNTRHFALSANFHGGALVVNYPWDEVYEAHPYENLVTQISQDYASLVPSIFNSAEFPGGLVNGADWYIVMGGMQDWSYRWHGDLQVTIEISEEKYPPYSQMPMFWKENREALLVYIESVHQGAGFYFDSNEEQGQVQLFNSNGEKLGTYAFHEGEFYKVLPLGKYEFRFSDGQRVPVEVRSGVEENNGNIVRVE